MAEHQHDLLKSAAASESTDEEALVCVFFSASLISWTDENRAKPGRHAVCTHIGHLALDCLCWVAHCDIPKLHDYLMTLVGSSASWIIKSITKRSHTHVTADPLHT